MLPVRRNAVEPAMIRNIIFDWSGTLVDDLPAVWEATNEVFRRSGVAELTLDQFRAEFSLPFTHFYHRFVPRTSPDQIEAWFHERFEQVCDRVQPLLHSRKFLENCRENKLRCFILTSVNKKYFPRQAKNTGLAGFFEAVFSGVVDKREQIRVLLDTHKLIESETLFIGDMQHDIEAARSGGVHSCAVLTGYNRLDQLRQSGPDVIVEHLRELWQLLESNKMEWPPIRDGNGAGHPIVTVGGLIINDAMEVLLVRTQKWSGLWGIPGGKVKSGETLEEALRREIKEETNLEVDDIRWTIAQDCIHSREFYRDAHFVLLNYTCRCHGVPEVILNDEAQEYRWLPFTEARKLSLNRPTRILLDHVRPRK
jgi:phosphoglycolate phosphatase-like HAD superfamily hydrolase/ADP-ribose pyrophosphatase YjhB (NUDIX family)